MAENSAKAPTKAPTKARVIIDHGERKIDDVISGPEAEAAVLAGHADDHPSAVAYAEKLARRKRQKAADAED